MNRNGRKRRSSCVDGEVCSIALARKKNTPDKAEVVRDTAFARMAPRFGLRLSLAAWLLVRSARQAVQYGLQSPQQFRHNALFENRNRDEASKSSSHARVSPIFRFHHCTPGYMLGIRCPR